jgi:hypothetical protein
LVAYFLPLPFRPVETKTSNQFTKLSIRLPMRWGMELPFTTGGKLGRLLAESRENLTPSLFLVWNLLV